MGNESDSVDPLHGTWGISLFPRTVRASTDAELPSDNKDLDSVHNFMKYLKMGSPERVLDEAKAIVDGGSELLNSESAKFAHSIGIDNDANVPEGKEKPQERRPGLGRKRARFSLKPNTSQPPAALESTLDIDQLQDPEEFFLAFEKLENAKKEIQKQKGVIASDINESSAYTNARHRRPGILGKSASYKYRFSSALLERDVMLTSSQETSEQVVQSASGHKSQETNVADDEIEDIGVVGSITNAENKVDEILDELLSSDNNDFDEDGALSLLQARLQIKPIDLSNLSIPEFQGVGKTDFKALGERLPKGRKSMSSMPNLVKQLIGKTPRQFNEAAENLITSTASPTPPRSPFPSLSLLKLCGLQSNQLRDPFSPLNVDLVEHKYPSGEDIDKQSDKLDRLKELSMSGKSRSEMEYETSRPSGSGMEIHTLESRGSDSSIDYSVGKRLDGQIRDTDTRPHESQTDLPDEMNWETADCDTARTIESRGSDSSIDDSVDKRLDGQIRDTEPRPHESQTDLPDEMNWETVDCDTARTIETNVLTKDPEQREENTGDTSQAILSSGEAHLNADDSTKSGSTFDAHVYHSSQVEVLLSQSADPAGQDVNIQSSRSVQCIDQNQLHEDGLASTAAEKDAADILSRKSTDRAKIPEKHLAQKQQCKGKRPRIGSRESKEIVLRPSLAAAGTSFDSGVRRSKRIRMRPLEYWKGERFLYGRIDKSLKLVGVKCISPSKGDGSLTVKSYVPDEYKEILQFAAHH